MTVFLSPLAPELRQIIGFEPFSRPGCARAQRSSFSLDRRNFRSCICNSRNEPSKKQAIQHESVERLEDSLSVDKST